MDSNKNPNVSKSFFSLSGDRPKAATAILGSTNCRLVPFLSLTELLIFCDQGKTSSTMYSLSSALI